MFSEFPLVERGPRRGDSPATQSGAFEILSQHPSVGVLEKLRAREKARLTGRPVGPSCQPARRSPASLPRYSSRERRAACASETVQVAYVAVCNDCATPRPPRRHNWATWPPWYSTQHRRGVKRRQAVNGESVACAVAGRGELAGDRLAKATIGLATLERRDGAHGEGRRACGAWGRGLRGLVMTAVSSRTCPTDLSKNSMTRRYCALGA